MSSIKNKKILNCFCFTSLLLLINLNLRCQLSGSFSVPGTYTSIAAAISDLNTQGVNGPVTININAGYTESAPIGGYTLSVSGTSANPIVFQKTGIGSNPLISAYSGGTGTPSSVFQDGILRMFGCDYITIDGIDLYDGNISNPSTMEFGYGLFRADTMDGCQYNTIKNCVITLNRNNNALGAGPSMDGSRGIEIIASNSTSHTSFFVATSLLGTNSFNTITTNTIQNCNIGISLYDSWSTPAFDEGNVIGGSAGLGNTIINFGGGVSSVKVTYAIVANNQKDISISHNYINNNDGGGVNHPNALVGILHNPAQNSNSSITSNTITIRNNSSVNSDLLGIYTPFNAQSNSLNISLNTIKNCAYTSSLSAGFFRGIINGNKTNALNINNNKIINNSIAAISGEFVGVCNMSDGPVMNYNNNYLDSIISTSPFSSVTCYGIQNVASSLTTTTSINSNTLHTVILGPFASNNLRFVLNNTPAALLNIKNNLASNISYTTTGGSEMFNVSSSQVKKTSVSSNTVTNISSTGNISLYYQSGSFNSDTTVFSNNLFSGIASGGGFSGLYILNNLDITISNNTLTSLSGTGITAIYAPSVSGTSKINNNLISNLSASTGTALGLWVNNGSPGLAIFSNTLSSLTALIDVRGISIFGSTGTNIYKNKINDLESTGNGFVWGINIQQAAATVTLSNNVIGHLRSMQANSQDRLVGVNLIDPQTGANYKLYNNSIYLNATSTSSDFGSYGIFHQVANSIASSTTTLKNNIVVNLSTPTGTGKTIAFGKFNPFIGISSNYDTTSCNNLYYAGTPSPNYYVYADNSMMFQNISAFKSAVYPREISTVTELPPFTSTLGTSPNFLNISPSVPTQVEKGAVPISGIADDVAGNTRDPIYPDIGAWEGNYTLLDLLPPLINNVVFITPNCNTTNRSFTVNLKDVSGLASGSLSPRCYYKINSGPYTSVQGSLISGNTQNGNWNFNLTYSANSFDVVSYFIVAQDIVTPSNLNSLPATGFSGTDVNTILSPPTSIYSYTVGGVLNGTYTVGTSGAFPRLTDAAYAYNNWCITGPMTFLLTNPNYSGTTGEVFPIVFQANSYASPSFSLLIKPDAGISSAITATTTAIKFLDAKHITLDGVNSTTTNLTINSINSGVWLASSNSLNAGCKKIEISNINISPGGQYGIIASVNASNPNGIGGADNDSIIIRGNLITNAHEGIVAAGSSSLSSGGLDGWIINNNTIGPAVSGTNNISGNGIYIDNVIGAKIENNLIRNLSIVSSSMVYSGIHMRWGNRGLSVLQNTITNVSSSVYSSGSSAISGIRMEKIANSVISKNVITNIYNTNTAGYGARGIIVYATTPSSVNLNLNLKIENNMISDIWSYSSQSSYFWPIGISIEGVGTDINIDNNSIYLSGMHAGITGTTCSSCIYFFTTGNNIRLRNNILANTYDNTGTTTDKCYAIYSDAPSSIFSSINYNNYYVGGSGNLPVLGQIVTTGLMSLSAIQAAFGGNINSKNIMPAFLSNTDLHLIPTSNVLLDNLGTPLIGITTDIDNQARNVSTPDIGADEYTAPPCSGANAGTQSISSFTLCSGQNVILNSSGASLGVGNIYQWMVSTTSGGPYTNVVGGSGSTTATYTSAPLNSGVYYYVMQNSCSSTSLTGISNEATVTVNPTPTITVTSSVPLLCQGSSATITSIGALNYTLNPGSITLNPCVISPIVTSNYVITGISVSGCTNQAFHTQNVTICTSITESSEKGNGFGVSPNPNNGEFTILLNSIGKNMQIEIYSPIGQIVLKEKLVELKTKINLKEIANGIYFVKVKEDGWQVYTIKIIKE